MKYKTKIISQGKECIGYVLQNDEVIFTSNLCKDTITAERAITSFINQQIKANVINQTLAVKPASQSSTTAFSNSPIPVHRISNSAAPSRCCGRG
jgi:hypothetical protein